MIQSKLKFDKTKEQAKSKFSNTIEIKNQKSKIKSNQTEAEFDDLKFANFTLGKTKFSSAKISLCR